MDKLGAIWEYCYVREFYTGWKELNQSGKYFSLLAKIFTLNSEQQQQLRGGDDFCCTSDCGSLLTHRSANKIEIITFLCRVGVILVDRGRKDKKSQQPFLWKTIKYDFTEATCHVTASLAWLWGAVNLVWQIQNPSSFLFWTLTPDGASYYCIFMFVFSNPPLYSGFCFWPNIPGKWEIYDLWTLSEDSFKDETESEIWVCVRYNDPI